MLLEVYILLLPAIVFIDYVLIDNIPAAVKEFIVNNADLR